MNLKQLYQYQNFLTELLAEARATLVVRSNCITETKTHMVSKANPAFSDYVEDIPTECKFDINVLVDFAMYIVGEKERLANRITEAKSGTGIDAKTEANKHRRELCDVLKMMTTSHNPKARKEVGRGFTFNVEGNQVPYSYEIDVVERFNYDKQRTSDALKALLKEANETSEQIDAVKIMTIVDYDPLFCIEDTFEDCVMKFADSHSVS